MSTNTESITILNEINCEIYAGESIAIVGSSGAGKSTLMTLLAGLDTPTSGTVSLLGQPISSMDEDQRAQLRRSYVGFVFQSFMLVETLSALDNVLLPCLLRDEVENTERAKQLLVSVGLEKRMNHRPAQLSGGEQQRVALARAFMTQPKILFADEPTGNLDQMTAQIVADLMFQLNQQYGTTLILVTHDTMLATRCQRQYEMTAGTLNEVVS